MEINLLHAIGDILFCEPIFRHYWEKEGVKPTVMIRDHLMYLQEYIDSAHFVPESTWSGSIDDMEMRPGYLPLRFANQVYRGYQPHDHHDFENMMLDKYRLAGLDPEMWKTLKINFNRKKANDLVQTLNLSLWKSYAVINNNSQAGEIKISEPPKDLDIIRMREVPGFTVLDWFSVLMCAEENHHVSTSTFFIMQAIENSFGLKGPVYVYPRPNEDGLRGISQLQPTFNLVRCE